VSRGADVDADKDGHLALFGEFFHKRMSHSGGHVPVDRPDFVAGLVLAEVLEVDAFALEATVVFPAEALADEPLGAQLDLADFFENRGDLGAAVLAERGGLRFVTVFLHSRRETGGRVYSMNSSLNRVISSTVISPCRK